MPTQKYDFKLQKAGDTFNGIRLTCTRTSNGTTSPIDLTGALINLKVKKESCFEPIIDISVDSGITLEDATNGVLRIDALLVPSVSSFAYLYDLQFTFTNGVVQTYLKGIFPIESDITD